MKKVFLYLFFISLISEISYATLVSKGKQLCAVCEKEIEVLRLVSYGGYVFEWESKYDIVYYPDTDPNFFWMCSQCGYSQYYSYFYDVTENEKRKLREYLANKWEPGSPNNISADMRLNQAVLVNKLLEKDDDFWAWFNRILIYNYRKLNLEKAKEYAKNEIKLLKRKKGKLNYQEKSRPYLIGEYNRMLGNIELAQDYFQAAKKVNLVTRTKIAVMLSIIIAVISIVTLPILWIKKGIALKWRILFTGLSLVTAIFFSIIIYTSPKVISFSKDNNDYYNKIIDERLELLNDPLKDVNSIKEASQGK